MSHPSGVRVTVVGPVVTGSALDRAGACRFVVASSRALPRAPYSGTVRLGGVERTVTGTHPCRLLKTFSVARAGETAEGAEYAVTVDLADESGGAGASYVAPGLGVRRPDEPVDVICKRIAGIFGRFCEEFRPPSVSVDLRD